MFVCLDSRAPVQIVQSSSSVVIVVVDFGAFPISQNPENSVQRKSGALCLVVRLTELRFMPRTFFRAGVRNGTKLKERRREANKKLSKKLLSRLDQMAHDFYMYITTTTVREQKNGK